jgi:type II secretory pathway pseudopilin PulG
MNNGHRRPVVPRRAGITLLEVLVACGILVVGLASLASVLPAAGSRLAQASVEDRAGIAAANAYAECVARGLITSDIFVSSTRACGFGRGFEEIVDQIDPASRRPRNRTLIASTTAAILQPRPLPFLTRIDEVRGFVLEDDLSFQPSAGDTPLNAFITIPPNQEPGHRLSRPGVCWGAMLAPVSGTAVAGAEATLSIAVFRKECEETASLSLTQQSGALYRVISGTTVSESGQTAYLPGPMGTNSPLPNADIAALRKQFVPGCGYVLMLPATGAANPRMPKWVRVTSSWTSNEPLDPANSGSAKGDVTYVALDLDGTAPASTAVIGFENLVRVDQYTVTLD